MVNLGDQGVLGHVELMMALIPSYVDLRLVILAGCVSSHGAIVWHMDSENASSA